VDRILSLQNATNGKVIVMRKKNKKRINRWFWRL